jgi:membrane-associated phospholipid phosphatase
MQQLFEWDQQFFFAINNGTVNSFFDWLMPIMRNSKTWVPLYIFILIFAFYKFRIKGIWWFLFAGCAVILCNYISSDLIKENIWRIRPCRDTLLAGQVRVFPGLYCPSSSSFTSSHAANHFGMAAYIFFTAGKQLRRWLWLFFIWAFIIIYAQVYVGVHYPGDVLAGSLVGLLTGGFVARIFNKRFGLLTFDNLPTAVI